MSLRALLVAVLVLSGCDDESDVVEQRVENVNLGGRAPAAEAAAPLELPGVDLASLGGADRRMASTLLRDLLSPCGEPISVARCVSEGTACNRCVPAARYVVRLAAEGLPDHEIRTLYRNRYDPAAQKTIDLEGAPVRGTPMGASVTLVVFSDFECPYCRLAHPLLMQLLREHEGRARLAFKHFPLSMHERAVPAALAAAAAQNQGKFWEMHDILFEHQDALTDADLERYAREIGLDLARFRADVTAEAARERVERDRAEGRELGVQGTPSIFINGRRFEEPFENLSVFLREELD
ncbi:MAG: thioredoxin domain-containing protein [Myxococcales bacterium]|nr:thioredoxin domain-containing protein [Myxococcales bacterium]